MVQLSQCNHPGCEVSCQPGTDSTCIVASPMLCSGQPNGRESCITLESGPTHSQASTKFVACNRRKSHAACEECCEQGYGWVCAKFCCWMLWHLKHIRIIAAMYVSSADLLSIHYARIQKGGRLQDLKIEHTQNCQNWMFEEQCTCTPRRNASLPYIWHKDYLLENVKHCGGEAE